jgi:hypothetical protein
LCHRFIINMPSKVVLASEVLASEFEEYDWVERECKLLQTTHTAESLLDALTRQKRRGTSAWWKHFTPIQVELADMEQKQRWWAVRLQCNECEAHLSARNPSNICSGHLNEGVCRLTARRRTAVQRTLSGALQEGAESAAGPIRAGDARSSSTLDSFVMSASKQKAFDIALADWFLCSNTPPSRATHP